MVINKERQEEEEKNGPGKRFRCLIDNNLFEDTTL